MLVNPKRCFGWSSDGPLRSFVQAEVSICHYINVYAKRGSCQKGTMPKRDCQKGIMPKRDYAKKGMPNYCRLKGMPNYNMPKRDKKGLCQKGTLPKGDYAKS